MPPKLYVELTKVLYGYNYNCVKNYFFQYLEMLRQAGPQEWVFEEYRDLNSLQFRYIFSLSKNNY